MLRRRLTHLGAAIIAVLLVAGCSEGGALEENVVRPGITAIEQASELACNSDAATLRTAMEAYELLEGAPAPDEGALIDGQYLRDDSALWDVVDGQLVPVDPGCGTVPTDAPDAVEIVTSTEPPMSADQFMATFTDEQVAAIGGVDCARALAEISAAAERYFAELGTAPLDLEQLVAAGHLDGLPTRWQLADDRLVPVDGSGCIDLG